MKQAVTFAGITAEPGERRQAMVQVLDTDYRLPVTVINGAEDGKTVLVTSAIHGCEYPSIEAVFRLAEQTDPQQVSGALVIINPVNVDAFLQRRPYIVIQDGKNLNRCFPPNPDGTLADKIAYVLTEEFIKKADFHIDTHGGDIPETQPSYVYYPGVSEDYETLQKGEEAADYILHAKYRIKSHATNHAYTHSGAVGTPSLELELGENGSWSEKEVEEYTENVTNVLRYLGVLPGVAVKKNPPAKQILKGTYIDAEVSGRWYPAVTSRDVIQKGQKIGEIKDLFGQVLVTYYAEYDAEMLMMVTSLAIHEGDALFAYGC